jgi:hypothetical protein
MGTHAGRKWWEQLHLGPAAAKLVGDRSPRTPAELAGLARADPEGFRRVFGADARADLSRALAARLAADPKDEAGYADLRDALEEVAGKQPLKPAANLPKPTYGVLPPPPGQARPADAHKLPNDLPRPGAARLDLPAPKPPPDRRSE